MLRTIYSENNETVNPTDYALWTIDSTLRELTCCQCDRPARHYVGGWDGKPLCDSHLIAHVKEVERASR